jgi:hypothetical protein
MNIQTVIANLMNTIEGKEQLLKRYLAPDYPNMAVAGHMVAFLEHNLTELKNILADCMAVREADIDRSWRENPDRSGGQFTQDEINDSGRWN